LILTWPTNLVRIFVKIYCSIPGVCFFFTSFFLDFSDFCRFLLCTCGWERGCYREGDRIYTVWKQLVFNCTRGYLNQSYDVTFPPFLSLTHSLQPPLSRAPLPPNLLCDSTFKGTVSQDFLLLVFFMNQFPSTP
jgi:hypothetical protein